jgi:type IV pilus assembly protein PilB
MQTTIKLTGSARSLVKHELLKQEAAQQALQEATNQGIPFLTYLVRKGILDAKAIATCLASDYDIPLLDLDAFDTELLSQKILSEDLARKYHILPLLHQGKKLYIAVSDPTNQDAFNQVRFQTGNKIIPILVEEDKLYLQLEGGLPTDDDQKLEEIAGLDNTDLDSIDITSAAADEEASFEDKAGIADEAPIIRFVNKIILDAINCDASDIHFEPYENEYRVRYRIDGVLQEIARPPSNLSGRLASRIKVMADLDISEKRLPQDGRFKLRLSKKRSVGFRINTCPTLFGEKIVLRILDPTMAKVGIDKLGFEDKQRECFEQTIKRNQGMTLVTGPTGSGKTVTLYTALNILNQPNINISTVEDPIEIYLSGINQVNVNNKTGLDFAMALRSFLRQDPDVIMVGEIRDTETAEIAIQAAQTGHLVLSTLHTNSAAETLTRLVNMNIAAFNIATSVSLVIAQRLVRCLCTKCRIEVKLEKAVLLDEGFIEEDLKELSIYKPQGCKACKDGYRGRIGIYEVLPITDSIGRIIMSNGSSLDIAERAKKEGMIDLRRAGLLKVKRGITSLEEVNRVTQE